VEVASGWASIALRGEADLTATVRDGRVDISRGGSSLATAEAGAKPKLRLEIAGGKARALLNGKELWSGESGATGAAALGVGGGQATFANWSVAEAK